MGSKYEVFIFLFFLGKRSKYEVELVKLRDLYFLTSKLIRNLTILYCLSLGMVNAGLFFVGLGMVRLGSFLFCPSRWAKEPEFLVCFLKKLLSFTSPFFVGLGLVRLGSFCFLSLKLGRKTQISYLVFVLRKIIIFDKFIV